MQQAEAACPPGTFGVQVSSSGEQNVEHLGTACVDDCGGVEWADGFIDPGLELGMEIKYLPNDIRLIAPECLFQFIDRVVYLGLGGLGHFHVLLQLGHAHKATISVKSAREEVTDGRSNLRGVRLERKMPGVEEAHDRVGDVALERLSALRQEEWVVLPPHRKEGRLVGAEILLERRVQRDIAL
jgi:hypothetical protein